MAFQLQTTSELACLANGQGTMFAKKGSMVAYQGQFKFTKVLIDPNGGGFLRGMVNQVARRVTGENMELMEVNGSGSCYFADSAQHVTVIDLEQGDQLSVESENLLAFNDACQYGVRFIGMGVLSQKGLFTSRLTPSNYGAQAAVKTDGNPIILQTPCVVDPDAVVCWTGPDPSFKTDVNWKTIIGQTSGESYTLDFRQPGYVVIVQPSERLSGLKIGLDDNRYAPGSQGSSFQNTVNEFQQPFGGNHQGHHNPNRNDQDGGLGGIIGNILRR